MFTFLLHISQRLILSFRSIYEAAKAQATTLTIVVINYTYNKYVLN